MKKSEAEPAIRQLIDQWLAHKRDMGADLSHPSFSEFRSLVEAQGFGRYFKFRSTAGPLYDAEMWCDEETGQMWRR